MNNEREPLVNKAITLYAYFGTPSSVFKALNSEYGESCLTAHAIKKIRETYRKEILEERKKLSAKIPLMDIDERWSVLQEIVDSSLAGDEIRTQSGSYIKYDRVATLNALKLAQEFATTKGTVNTEDDELVKQIVEEAYQALKLEKPDSTEEDIIKEIRDSLGDKVAPYLDDLKTEPLYVQ